MTTEPEAIPADVLEACPFCGSHVSIKGDAELCAIVCEDGACAGSGLMSLFEPKDRAAAINTWNRRASRVPVDGAVIAAAFESGAAWHAINGHPLRSVDDELEEAAKSYAATHPAPASPDAEMVGEAERLKALRKLCGYVENGTDTSITISQDDATKSWIVRVGTAASVWGETFGEAIDAAICKHGGDR